MVYSENHPEPIWKMDPSCKTIFKVIICGHQEWWRKVRDSRKKKKKKRIKLQLDVID